MARALLGVGSLRLDFEVLFSLSFSRSPFVVVPQLPLRLVAENRCRSRWRFVQSYVVGCERVTKCILGVWYLSALVMLFSIQQGSSLESRGFVVEVVPLGDTPILRLGSAQV